MKNLSISEPAPLKCPSPASAARVATPLAVPLESVAVTRLIEEIQSGPGVPLTGYNRTYHRHNR